MKEIRRKRHSGWTNRVLSCCLWPETPGAPLLRASIAKPGRPHYGLSYCPSCLEMCASTTPGKHIAGVTAGHFILYSPKLQIRNVPFYHPDENSPKMKDCRSQFGGLTVSLVCPQMSCFGLHAPQRTNPSD